MNETDSVVIRPSLIHGLGGFAQTDLAKGARVIAYRGERIPAAESIERCRQGNACIFRLDENWHLDGNLPENAARFLNHSCCANCEATLIDGQVWLVAVRDIAAGEEITFDYGYDLEDFWSHPCHCGAPQCVGYILAEELRSAVPPHWTQTGRSTASD
jgi:uncharacterized protein